MVPTALGGAQVHDSTGSEVMSRVEGICRGCPAGSIPLAAGATAAPNLKLPGMPATEMSATAVPYLLMAEAVSTRMCGLSGGYCLFR